jgi:hypothetical protein
MLVQTDFFSEILTFIKIVHTYLIVSNPFNTVYSETCLNRIALENQYPQSTSYKLYLRWAQCLYHTGDMDQATHSTVFRYSVKSV